MFALLTTLLALGIFTSTVLAAPALAPAPAPASHTFKAPAPYDFISLSAAGKNIVNLPGNFESANTDANLNSGASSLVKRNIGGVRLSDGANFTGHVWYGIFPLNTCIDLRDYAGHLLSFRPDEGTECLVMQGRCDGNDEFADLFYNSTNIGNLGEYFWIGSVASYICLEE